MGRPYFLTITSSSIFWGNSISRREIPWELIERIGCTPNNEAEPGLMIKLKDGRILDVEHSCFNSISSVREAILQASGFYPFHLAPDLFAPPGLLGEWYGVKFVNSPLWIFAVPASSHSRIMAFSRRRRGFRWCPSRPMQVFRLFKADYSFPVMENKKCST